MAAEVNGNSEDRAQILQDFEDGRYNVLCNSMLLTEGYDCPAVDCIIVLRPTKSRPLYAQMIGRGTRLSPETGKEHLLLIDFCFIIHYFPPLIKGPLGVAAPCGAVFIPLLQRRQ